MGDKRANKEMAMDLLDVRVTATPREVEIKMAAPLKFASIERKHTELLSMR